MRWLLRIIRAGSKALIDLVGLMMLFPVLSIKYTIFRVGLAITLYSLRGLDYDRMVDVVDQVKVIFAEYPRKVWDRIVAIAQNAVIQALNVAEIAYEYAGELYENLLSYFQSSKMNQTTEIA